MTAGTIAYTLAIESYLRRPGMPWWSGILTGLAFLVSLALAIALDLRGLFFLIIVFPVMVVFMTIYGVWNSWIAQRTGSALPGAISAGLALAGRSRQRFRWSWIEEFPALTIW